MNKIVNIGPKIEELLLKVGIDDYEKLKSVGSKETFLRINAISGDGCLNMLYALEGAVQGVRWHYLNGDIKEELKRFFMELKK